MEGAARIPDITKAGEVAAFIQGNIPAVCLIVDVIPQMLRHLHGVQLVDVIPAQVVVILDTRVNVIAIQVFRQVDDLLDAAGMVADLHGRLELLKLAPVHFIQLRRQVIQFVQALVFAQLVIEAIHITVIVRDEPFLIDLPEVARLSNPDPVKHLLHFLGGGRELYPLAHKLALVVLPKVRHEGGKGIILVISIYRHRSHLLKAPVQTCPLPGASPACLHIPFFPAPAVPGWRAFSPPPGGDAPPHAHAATRPRKGRGSRGW